MNVHNKMVADSANRRSFIGGSDARVIMGDDEAALQRGDRRSVFQRPISDCQRP
jgi:hypothetical protein